MKLKTLFESANLPIPRADQEVTRITSNSEQVEKGSVFVAVRGMSHDGHDYLVEAKKRGAIICVGETATADLQVADSRLALAQLASAFFGHPSRNLKVFGVTGTSGKTTTTYLIESILKKADLNPGVIGTINFRLGQHQWQSTHTTPGPVELQRLLYEMKSLGARSVVMEVSSHALKQRRVAGIAFDGVAFTNLSQDHLDFHPDMEDYYLAKKMLFTDCIQESRRLGKSPVCAVNLDDAYGSRLARELMPESALFTFQASREWDQNPFQTSLVGQFNRENILAAATLLHAAGIDLDVVKDGVESLSAVPGRLEPVPNSKGIQVLVDYAHKPDALEKVLKILRALPSAGQLICVFGCGGDRDRKKRPLMGKIAAANSHHVIVTSDNPRTENPEAILAEILAGMGGAKNYEVEPDRAKAIKMAIKRAKTGDTVVIAGKGHEDYQILGREKIHFDDREVASQALTSDLEIF